MTLQEFTGQTGNEETRRGRGPTRLFPVSPLSDALRLPRSILQYGLDGKIVRFTLLAKLEQTHEYTLTRDLITSSSKYGLTTGSFASAHLEVTDDGRAALALDSDSVEGKNKLFEIGIIRINPFNKLYQKLKDKPLPDATVLKDELHNLGVTLQDSEKATEVFTANIEFLGLLVPIKGRNHVGSIESIIAQLPSTDETTSTGRGPFVGDVATAEVRSVQTQTREMPLATPSPPNLAQTEVVSNEPSVHIDVQIHIDSSANPDQIDQIFASMARHLYGRQG